MQNWKIIQRRKYYLVFSAILVAASLVLLFTWGLKPGIDFTGGSLLTVNFVNQERPSQDSVRESLKDLNLGDISFQPVGDNGYDLKFKTVDEETHQSILNKLKENYSSQAAANPVKIEATDQNGNPVNLGASALGIKTTSETDRTAKQVEEARFDSIGPAIGAELKTRSLYAIILVSLAIILYIAWSFRKVGGPIASWKYGLLAVVALIHDVSITCGAFVLLGYYLNIEVGTAFIAALLTILGYSVNDTIVVYDRTRENLRKYSGDFEEIVNKSVNETMVRSFNTSFTVMLTLLAVFVFGGASIKFFALALLIGVFFGTYSSIFVASALLVTWHKMSHKFSK